MSRFKFIKAILRGDYMKISDIVSKKVIDEAINKSTNIESLVSIIVTVVVGAIVANIFSKSNKDDSGYEG